MQQFTNSTFECTPDKHKHYDSILELARQKASGEFEAGWWQWSVKKPDGNWLQLDPIDFSCCVYKYEKTDKHPDSRREREQAERLQTELKTKCNFNSLHSGQIFCKDGNSFAVIYSPNGNLGKHFLLEQNGYIINREISTWEDLIGFERLS